LKQINPNLTAGRIGYHVHALVRKFCNHEIIKRVSMTFLMLRTYACQSIHFSFDLIIVINSLTEKYQNNLTVKKYIISI
jgi:hypothetical protein